MELNKKKKYLSLMFSIIAVDQISKYFIRSNFNLYEQIDVIKGFFKIIYIRNTGVIWGIFAESKNQIVPIVIAILSVIALLTVVYIFIKTSSECRLELVSLSFITGGALGNLTDRFILGYVVDFIDIYIRNYHWPTFNIADSFISIGIVMLLISVLLNRCPAQHKGD